MNHWNCEEVKGTIELSLKKGETEWDKIDEFSLALRKEYELKGKSIKEFVSSNPETKKDRVIFSYEAKVYDFDFEGTNKYFETYNEKIKVQTTGDLYIVN